MKQGRTLEEVMKEIEEQSRMKEDFIVDTRSLVFTNNGEEQLLSMADETYHINDLAHGQIAEAISVPVKGLGRSYAWHDLLKADADQVKLIFDVTEIACECYD